MVEKNVLKKETTVYPPPKDSVFYFLFQKARLVLREEDFAFFEFTRVFRQKNNPNALTESRQNTQFFSPAAQAVEMVKHL